MNMIRYADDMGHPVVLRVRVSRTVGTATALLFQCTILICISLVSTE